MGELIQTDIFKDFEESELDHFKKKLEEIAASLTRVRRGTYAEIGRLKQDNFEMKERLNIMERYICNGTIRN